MRNTMMINMLEVNETNNMIDNEKLDVRTITMGISLLDCAASTVEDHLLRQRSGLHRRRNWTRVWRSHCK